MWRAPKYKPVILMARRGVLAISIQFGARRQFVFTYPLNRSVYFANSVSRVIDRNLRSAQAVVLHPHYLGRNRLFGMSSYAHVTIRTNISRARTPLSHVESSDMSRDYNLK